MTDQERLDLEKQWLEESDPAQLVQRAPVRHANQRKTRLCAVGCCRHILDRISEQICRDAIDVAERFADRRGFRQRLGNAHRTLVYLAKNRTEKWIEAFQELTANTVNLYRIIWHLYQWTYQQALQKVGADRIWREIGNQRLCCLIRDVIGNPYGPVAAPSSWLNANVSAIALAIYTDRRFDDMPILADSLEEAGCMDAVILEHCREMSPHTRGCWVVDLILSKDR